MVKLIDCSYFTKGERQILNAPSSSDNLTDQAQIAIRDTIDGFVESLQDEFLRNAVGRMTATLLSEYLELKDAASEVDVNDDEDTGFEEDAELEKILSALREPFADFVFFRMMRATRHQVTTTGVVQLKCANDYVSPARLQADAWNRMVDGMFSFMEDVRPQIVSYAVVISWNYLKPINHLNL
jgi:hypothetical protein